MTKCPLDEITIHIVEIAACSLLYYTIETARTSSRQYGKWHYFTSVRVRTRAVLNTAGTDQAQNRFHARAFRLISTIADDFMMVESPRAISMVVS